MDWDHDMQDMLSGLQRLHYVEVRPSHSAQRSRKSTTPFRSDTLATTALGSEYLASIPKACLSSHARKRQLDREIEQSLATANPAKSQFANLLADPVTAKVFAREMRHELQKKQTSETTGTALATRPFVVKRLEDGHRALFGRYPNEGEARQVADRINGWIEHEGRVIYGAGRQG